MLSRASAAAVRRAARASVAPLPRVTSVRFMCDTHDDFKPKRKAPESGEFDPSPIRENKVMLYMKGTPEMPQCGFSAQVARILQAEGIQFASANVLADPVVREGVKQHSNWPTIPQLYVDGEFVGGCDIVTQMFQSGELSQLFNEAGVPKLQ